jgi:archaellum component FlaF (FlaF/FlaG flagellin family)
MFTMVEATAQQIANASTSSLTISGSNSAAIIISVISTIIALSSVYYTYKNYRINKTQEDDRQRKKLKAILSATLIHKYLSAKESNLYLKVRNSGEGKARAISFLINDEVASSDSRLILSQSDLARFNELEPNTDFHSRKIIICGGGNMEFHVKLTWSDDSGEPGIFDQTLTPVVETT